MELNEIIEKTREQMNKSLEHYKQQLAKVRTGRANASILDNVKVDYYGTPTPIPQVATINVPDAKTIIIQPWDTSIINAIEKAIKQSDLGFNPVNDGRILRIPVPPLTEERRKEIVKFCKKLTEDAKIAIRNIRRDQIEVIRKAEKDKELTEDDRKLGEEKIQKVTDEFIKKIDELFSAKEKEILET
ncbi:MAG: Ribosome recycling factor [Candidatus Kapaibacterium sp.]|jgi:ribosome recycling factor|nr:MAG: Ribosome recycling factor [Candidatus Kapabacteria bacterium]ROL56103.1 MAG: ribosome recycling factor [Bacteroidetes/Chlorobi group bacterium Naka2016]